MSVSDSLSARRRKPAWTRRWLMLCLLAVSADLCRGARDYQPVFGDPMLEPWRWRTFPELSGLDVQCITEGADGTMWYGTANGLWSYNGYEWLRHSTNVSRVVTALCSLPDGTIYAGGGRGISRFDRGQWTPVLAPTGPRITNVSDIPIRKIVVDRDGSPWVAMRWGALRWRQSTWTLYTDPENAERLRDDLGALNVNVELLPAAMVARLRPAVGSAGPCDLTDACVDQEGRIWFGTMGGQVICYTPASPQAGSWRSYDEADGIIPGAVSSIAALHDGKLWVVHAEADLANVFDGRSWQALRLPLFLPALDVGDAGGRLFQTRDGVIWLAARYMLFAHRDGQWRKYGQPELPYPSTRNALTQSSDGALWFSGANSEVHRVDYQTARWLTLEDLNFQWESPTGTQWFLHRDGRIVVHEAGRWTSLGIEDGLMDTPVAVLGTRNGDVWAAGSHGHTAATARFDGRKWTRHIHESFSFSVDWRGVFESSDGSLWFGAFVDSDGPPQHLNGILQFRNGTWIHHRQAGRSPETDGAQDPATLLPPSTHPDRPIEKFVCFGESRDGKIWAARNIIAFHDRQKWELLPDPPGAPPTNIESMLSTAEGDLWIGTRESGARHFDGKNWRQFHIEEGLIANSIRSLAQTVDGSIWAVTDRGSSRFDGSTWTDDVLPEQLSFPHESGSLKASPSGRLWINRYTLYWMRRAWTKSPPPAPDAEFRTVSHQFRGPPPQTAITTGGGTISPPGNLAVLWTGIPPWRRPKDARLQFSFRLDDQPWSPFTSAPGHSFFTLPPGPHHLEVRARDADFNLDPTPATLDFVVLPPVWRQGWFILLMVVLCGLIVTQSIRVLLQQARLRRAHDELEVRVRQRTAQLEAANRELEAFSYSVSHDLRGPLRSIDGFSKTLADDYADKLDEDGRNDLQRVRAAAQRMGQIIDDMLKLSRMTRGEMQATSVDLSLLVGAILDDLARNDPARRVHLAITPNVVVRGDRNLLGIAMENLLGNAWKFTSRRDETRIEFGVTERAGERVYFVRDNGAGFDMACAQKLFGAFQRLHSNRDFPGTGIGLAIVQRIITRHGGRIWAEAVPDGGATFSFTLGNQVPEPAARASPHSRPP